MLDCIFAVDDAFDPLATIQVKNSLQSVAIVDARLFTREALTAALFARMTGVVLKAFPDMHIVASAREVFDLVLVAVPSGASDALDHDIQRLADTGSSARVVALVDGQLDEVRQRWRHLLASGARGIVPVQMMSLNQLPSVLHFVKAGGVFVPAELLHKVQLAGSNNANSEDRVKPRLTERQNAVFRLLATGAPNKVIAHRLSMSESTVKVHVKSIMRRVGATNRTQAVFKLGLVGRDASSM